MKDIYGMKMTPLINDLRIQSAMVPLSKESNENITIVGDVSPVVATTTTLTLFESNFSAGGGTACEIAMDFIANGGRK